MMVPPLKSNTYTTNVVEFNSKDNAYHFNQGFCIMHQVTFYTKTLTMTILTNNDMLIIYKY